MTHASSTTPEHRANLRRLKAEFEAAFHAVEDVTDKGSLSYREADARYRAWIKAMDAVAIALLDDIDAFEAAEAKVGRERERVSRRAEIPINSAEVDHVFAEIADFQDAEALIGVRQPPLFNES